MLLLKRLTFMLIVYRLFPFVCRLILVMCQSTKHLYRLHLARKVEEGCRLVKDDETCLMGESLGNHDLLTLAIAELPDIAIGKMGNAHLIESFCDDLFVGRRKRTEETSIGRATHAHDISYAELCNVEFGGENHAHFLSHFLGRIKRKRFALKENLALKWRLKTRLSS